VGARLGPACALAAAVAAALAGAIPAAAQDRSPPSPCARADYLVSVGRLKEAREEYLEIRKLLNAQCATDGIGKVAERRVQALRKLAEIERLRKSKAPDAEEREKMARAELETLDGELAAAAKPKEKPEEPKHERKGKKGDTNFEKIANYGKWVLSLLAFAGLGLLAAVVVGRIPPIRRLARRFSKTCWAVARADDDTRKRFWRWVLRGIVRFVDWFYGVQFRVDSIDGPGKGAGDPASVKSVLQDAFGGSAAELQPGVDLTVAAPEAGSLTEDLAEAVKDLPHGAIAAALLRLGRKILPRDAFFLRGRLIPPNGQGIGLTLLLSTSRGHVRYTATLWEADYYPTPESASEDEEREPPLYRLAVAGAAWAQYMILEHRGDERARGRLGAQKWESFALLQAGIHAHDEEESFDDARILYAAALGADESNHPARLNLGAVQRRLSEPELAIENLEPVEHETVQIAEDPCTANADGDADG
jgi:hypothetical protein